MGKEIVNTPKVHPYTPVIPVSLATKCGNLVFISGQLSRNEKGENVHVGDGVNQARQVFANMKALIEAAGGTMEDICKMTVFLTDLSERPAIWKMVQEEVFHSNYPACSLVQVVALANPDWKVEVEAIAVI